jgi:hypothetical protein
MKTMMESHCILENTFRPVKSSLFWHSKAAMLHTPPGLWPSAIIQIGQQAGMSFKGIGLGCFDRT